MGLIIFLLSFNTQSVKAVTTNLENAGFENPVITSTFNNNGHSQFFNQDIVPGWQTDAKDGEIELWRESTKANPQYPNLKPIEGNQFLELNSNMSSSLFQDVETTPGQLIYWEVSHRGREGIDTAHVSFGAPNSDLVRVQTMTTGKNAWVVYSGFYTVPEGQYVTRFQIEAGNRETIGNFIDNIIFTSEIPDDVKDRGVDIIKEVNKAEAQVGDVLTYTIQVTNTTDSELSDFTFHDSILDSTLSEFIEGSIKLNGTQITDDVDSDQGHFNNKNNEVVVDLFIAPNDTVTISFDVIILEASRGKTIKNTAMLHDLNNPHGPIYSNTVSTIVPQVTIKKIVNLSSAIVGDKLTYELIITNESDFTINNYKVSDSLETNLVRFINDSILVDGVNNTDILDEDNAHFVDGIINVSLPQLEAGQSSTIIFSVLVLDEAKGSSIKNIAVLSNPNIPDIPIYSEEVITDIYALSIEKEVNLNDASIGDNLSYKINVTNSSPFIVNDFVVIDNLDPNLVTYIPNSIKVNGIEQTDVEDNDLAFYNDGTIKVSLPLIEVNSVVEITFDVTVLEAALGKSVLNSAILYNLNDPELEINSNEVETVIKEIEIIKEVNKVQSSVGDTLSYTLTVNNVNKNDVYDLLVKDTLDSHVVKYVPSTLKVDGNLVSDAIDEDNGSVISNEVHVVIPLIKGAETVKITFDVIVLDEALGKTIINTATLTDLNNPHNNKTSNEVETEVLEADKIIIDDEVIDLEIIKEVNVANASVNDIVTYTLTINNIGINTVNDIEVIDLLNSELVNYIPNTLIVNGNSLSDAQDGDNGSVLNNNIIVSIPYLNGLDYVVIKFDVLVLDAAAGEIINNIAYIVDPNNPENNTESNEVNTSINKKDNIISPILPDTGLSGFILMVIYSLLALLLLLLFIKRNLYLYNNQFTSYN